MKEPNVKKVLVEVTIANGLEIEARQANYEVQLEIRLQRMRVLTNCAMWSSLGLPLVFISIRIF